MKARDIMTSEPFSLLPSDTVTRAAELMRNIDVGAIPVVSDHDSRALAGIITDRDIVIRCVADGHPGPCQIGLHMTPLPLQCVEPGDDMEDVIAKMERAQVRRIPVIDADSKLLGVIAQADIARKLGPTEPQMVEEVLEKISTPPPIVAV